MYKEVPHLFCPWATSRVEPKLRTAELGEQRRMDLVLVAHLSGIMADPTVVDGASQGDVDARGRNEKAERAVTAAEGVKRAYYGPDLPAARLRFLPGRARHALRLWQGRARAAASLGGDGRPACQQRCAAFPAPHRPEGEGRAAASVGGGDAGVRGPRL